MANKQTIKKSEAKILRFINQIPKADAYISNLSTKLDIDYGYIIRILAGMESKGWITKNNSHGRTFVILTSEAPLEEAKEVK